VLQRPEPRRPFAFLKDLAASGCKWPMRETDDGRHLLCNQPVADVPLSVTSIALANDLDVPVTEEAGDGQMANCASAMVSGLNANGDGFLAVRSGPGSQYRKIDELHDGETVLDFDRHGKWAGIVYRSTERALPFNFNETPPGHV
jgi:hypothetical protein